MIFAIYLINRYNLHKHLPISKICANIAEQSFNEGVYSLIG